jgi:hypothetical protein
MLSGEGKVYNELRLNDTVAKLKKIILADMTDIFDIDVLLEGKQLGAQCILKEAGLHDGSDVTVVLTEDDMPALVSSSSEDCRQRATRKSRKRIQRRPIPPTASRRAAP